MLEVRPGRRIVCTRDESKVKDFKHSCRGANLCLGVASRLRGVGSFREGPEHDRGYAREAAAGGVPDGVPFRGDAVRCHTLGGGLRPRIASPSVAFYKDIPPEDPP